ncbi:HlyD family secretion protein [Vibrio sp. E150_018]
MTIFKVSILAIQNWRMIFGISLVLLTLNACSPTESPQASGTLERERIRLLATSSEIITSLPIKQGSVVKVGQVIAQLDPTTQKAILAKAKAERDQQQANLNKMLNGERSEDIDVATANLNSAKAELLDAQKHLKRINELVNRKLASIADQDNALYERDTKQGQYDSAYKTWLKLTNGNRIEDIEFAKAQLAAAKAEVMLQQHKLQQLTVVATRNGILDSLPYNLGERVTQNSVVAIIQSNSAPYARVYLPEQYKHSIQVGSSLMVHIDGVKQALRGKLRWISVDPAFTPYRNMTEEDRSRLVYLAEIDLPKEASQYAAGIPLQVDLESEHE